MKTPRTRAAIFAALFLPGFGSAAAWGKPASAGLAAGSCVPNATTLCISDQVGDNRFKVQVAWSTAQSGGQSGMANAVPALPIGFSQGGVFWFFSSTNPEMLVKVLNGCSINQNYWVFASAGTNVGLTATVTDTVTGAVKTYTNPDLTPAQPIQDVTAFPCVAARPPATPGVRQASQLDATETRGRITAPAPVTPENSVSDAGTAFVAGGVAGLKTLFISDQPGDYRFGVQVAWSTTQGGGQSGLANAVPAAPVGFTQGGIFWFFSGSNPEMFVKVLNGCSVNQHYWVFASAGTNVGLTVTVTDAVTGAVKTYTNPDLTPAPPIQDLAAFPCVAGPSPPLGDPGGDTVSKLVVASTGGTLQAADGTVLTIPPNALTTDTLIGITTIKGRSGTAANRAYLLEPAGLTFQTPATLTLQAPAVQGSAPDTITVNHSSVSNAILDLGSELTNSRAATPLGTDATANTIDIRLDHFSIAFVSVDEYGYIVLDIPQQYLKPGDILFALTDIHLFDGPPPRPNWGPGHVGVYAGTSQDTSRIIESTSPPGVRTNTLLNFKTSNDHLYMGARRPMNVVTDTDRANIVAYCEDKLGSQYSLIGDGAIAQGRQYSCVGLAEAAYKSAGKPLLANGYERVVASVPLEVFNATLPVDEVSICPNHEYSMQVYGVSIDPASPYYSRVLAGWYRKDPSTSGSLGTPAMTCINQPVGADFHVTQDQATYSFKWTPTSAQAGQTYSMIFDTTMVQGATGEYTGVTYYWSPLHLQQSFTINVKPYCGLDHLSPATASVNVGANVTLQAIDTSGNVIPPSTLSWSASPTGIASVTNGQVTGLSGGGTVVTATETSDQRTATATIAVIPATGDGVIPGHGLYGTPVTIYGSGFAGTRTKVGFEPLTNITTCDVVGFDPTSVPATVSADSTDSVLHVTVPEGANSGCVYIQPPAAPGYHLSFLVGEHLEFTSFSSAPGYPVVSAVYSDSVGDPVLKVDNYVCPAPFRFDVPSADSNGSTRFTILCGTYANGSIHADSKVGAGPTDCGYHLDGNLNPDGTGGGSITFVSCDASGTRSTTTGTFSLRDATPMSP